jgi:3',5'-cyclic-AMP phosphodiesterase
MRIAQLSDPHVRIPGNPLSGRVETLPYLERAISTVEALRPRPDLVLITGDIVDQMSAEEYAFAKQALDRLTLPTFVLPGNHDDRTGMAATLGAYLGDVLGTDCLAYAVDRFPVRVLMLDSAIPMRGQGRLGEGQLEWLRNELAAQPGRPTLIALHHPPFEVGIGFMEKYGLLDRTELGAVISRHAQVVGVVAGHIHRTIVGRVGTAVGMVAPSTAHQVPLDLSPDGPETFVFEPPGFLLHEWDGRGLRSHQVYVDSFGPWYRFG